MKIITTIGEMKKFSDTIRFAGKKIGLVPTMGALHNGHLSLVACAKKHCDVVVMSIFVNPIQFGPQEDFSKYPRPFEDDCKKAEACGCDAVFAPTKSEMYPDVFLTSIVVDKISNELCGKSRPGHFTGVATVVLKFFNIVAPHIAVFGQKDAQQCIVLQRMVRDLNVPIKLVFMPTLRESDGLAMSSRNVYLSSSERRDATRIYKALSTALTLYNTGEKQASVLHTAISDVLKSSDSFTTEYLDIVDTEQLMPCISVHDKTLIAIAVRTKESKTRLIDNIILGGTF